MRAMSWCVLVIFTHDTLCICNQTDLLLNLGFTLTDLRFVETGMPDFRKDGSWNTMKDEKLDKVIAEMQRYQREPYCIVEKGDVMQLVAACLESN